jgi:hypothetical protein
VEASTDGLAVSNAAPDLEAEGILHLFERFWRKSRSVFRKGTVRFTPGYCGCLQRAAQGNMSSYLEKSSPSHRNALECVSGLRD